MHHHSLQVWDRDLREILIDTDSTAHRCFCWSIDSTRLFALQPSQLTRISVPSGYLKDVAMQSGAPRDIAMHPEGTWMAAAIDDRIDLIDPATLQRTAVLSGHTEIVEQVKWAPDGKRLASLGSENAIRLWDATAGKQVCNLRLPGADEIESIEWTADGRFLLVGRRSRANPFLGRRVKNCRDV